MKNYFRFIIIAVSSCLAYSCATPSSPTGGPRDKQGPAISSTDPETGTVNFKKDKVVLNFSEFVKRGSLPMALTIEPALGIKHTLNFGRKSVAIEFGSKIPEKTTLIITVGTGLKDLNGNAMASPFQLAISTGPNIDKGKLLARVLDARTGKGKKADRVLLYRSPVDLSNPANYIGETDTSGVVKFSYLSKGTYKAFWVDDRNRNKIWDRKQERAQPFKKEFITLPKAGKDTLGTLYIANSDTSKPVLQGVGLFSSRRMHLRFSENVVLSDSTRLQVQDSTGKKYSSVFPLYVSPDMKYVLFAHSKKKLAPDHTYQLSVQNIADEAGNVQTESVQAFTGSSQKDTTAQRIIGSSAGEGLFPDEPFIIAYAKPITQASVRDSLRVIEGRKSYKRWKNLAIQRNKMKLPPHGRWKEGVDYEFRFWNPHLQKYHKVNPTIWHDADLGALNISFEDSTSKEAQRPTHLVLTTTGGRLSADTTFTESIEIDSLAPVKHRLRMYQDLNNNGKWDQGTVAPFKAPEPFYVRNNIPVQKGFTSNLTVSFKR